MLMNLLKYATLTTSQLTPFVVADIAKSLLQQDVDVSDETFNEIVAALKEDNIDRVADIAQKPELVAKLKRLISEQEVGPDDNLIVCPHCGEFINPS